ncbi:MAG TPA: MCE family protein [Mycobacterium sp.]|jgi:phospholipid/cholesterol/gamma-HCH transport system substrate-binding protein|nr:MCE family protein [Mycobacterium sp.]
MPLLKRRFSERSSLRIGAVTLLVTITLLVASLNLGKIVDLFAQVHLAADFSQAGNLAAGDDVRLSGVAIGRVKSVELEGEHVRVEFSVRDQGTLGGATRASIQTATVLGKRFLALLPAGTGKLTDGDVIPLSRTDSPYDLIQILSTLSTKSEALDKPKLAEALDTISREFANSPAPLRSALQGVGRLSATLGSRDVTLRDLLAHAQTFTDVLARRSNDIVRIVADGNLLLAEINARRDAIDDLLVSVTDLLNVLHQIAGDNDRQLGPALDQLNSVLDMLRKNSAQIAAVIHGMNLYTGSLGEIANSSPLFMASVQNIAPPTNLVPGLPLGAYDTQKQGAGPPVPSLPGPPVGGAPSELPKGPVR